MLKKIILTLCAIEIMSCATSNKLFPDVPIEIRVSELSLPLSNEDKTSIRQCTHFFVTHSIAQIIEEQEQLLQFKEHVESIPPLKLIYFVLIDPDTKQNLKSLILEDNLKQAYAFLALEMILVNVIEDEQYEQHISEFAKFLNLNENTIQNHFTQKNYQDLTKYLLQI